MTDMTSDEIAIRDAEFFKSFKTNRTINRAEFNEKWALTHKKVALTPKNLFLTDKKQDENVKKIYDFLYEYCVKFPNVATKNIILVGGVGVGKTFAMDLVRKTLTAKYNVVFTTAFSMYNAFLKHSNTFGRDDGAINEYLNCDLLCIDDLGAEPVTRNITDEYFSNIINNRLVSGRPFIITTNLMPEDIIAKYDQRFASRVFSKTDSAILKFTGADLRKK
jgi:DNA replication protein DnaC